MRWRTILATVAVSAATVVVVDVVLQSSLLAALFPRVESPADGARLAAPVTVRWSGPRQLRVRLAGPAGAHDLGWRSSPLEIPADRLPERGEYTLELRPPLFGRLLATTRSFAVVLSAGPRRTAAKHGDAPDESRAAELEALRQERDTTSAVNADLYEENAQLRRENTDLAEDNSQLQLEQSESQQQIDALAAQRAELEQRQAALEEENRALRGRLASIPPCLAWGYLTYPRPQLLPRTRRVVVVSNTRGEIFRDERECESFRRQDQNAASRCDCVAGP